jgi:hypothetical protein
MDKETIREVIKEEFDRLDRSLNLDPLEDPKQSWEDYKGRRKNKGGEFFKLLTLLDKLQKEQESVIKQLKLMRME